MKTLTLDTLNLDTQEAWCNFCGESKECIKGNNASKFNWFAIKTEYDYKRGVSIESGGEWKNESQNVHIYRSYL